MTTTEYSIKKTPKQKEAIRLIASCETALLEGGSRCVSGGTIIDGQEKTIKELAEIGKPVRVITSHGYEIAEPPFKKGSDLLYEVKVEDGRKIEVTDDHRFWDGKKWIKTRDIRPGYLLACLPPSLKNGYVLKSVSSVTATTVKDYYTLTVPSSAQYFANGFLNHNSGKTFIVCYAYVLRALKYPGSRHLMARFRLSHAILAICHETMPDVLKLLGLTGRVKLNRSLWYYEFPNGSTIWIGGLDDKKRLENILGREYATIFLNEASQISFEAYEILITRLNPPKGIKGKYIIDYNPPSISHWGYLMFHKRQFPDGRPVPAGDFLKIKMNPEDNKENISEAYLYNLSLLSEAKRKRFAKGEYSLESGKLWKRADIRYYPEPENLPDFVRVVVAVDPSGSVGGDEIGIIVAGSYFDKSGDLKQMTIDDYSLHATPAIWAAEVSAAYKLWSADCVVAEKNFGGDMVESTIKNADKTINVKLIHSSRGKVVRAEPISAMYEENQKQIYHRRPFTALEDEMCTYDPEVSQSPNRMDALVFAHAELGGGDISILDVI